jgi:hypothetical protein
MASISQDKALYTTHFEFYFPTGKKVIIATGNIHNAFTADVTYVQYIVIRKLCNIC